MTSLNTKYRPKTFDEYIGHAEIVDSVKKALDNNLSRAFLLTGPSGIGKTSLARIIAKYWGVEDLNLIEIDAAKYTGIDDMQNVMNVSRMRGFGSPKKAIIIDEMHGLSHQAVKSILKSLEEPPEHLLWILATTEPSKIPITVKTRCFCYDLKSISKRDLVSYLFFIDESEGFQTEASIIKLAAEKAEGSPRQALENLGLVSGLKDLEAAKRLLDEAEEPDKVINLCRALANKRGWTEVIGLLKNLEDVQPETIRLIVLSYFTKMALNGKVEALRIMEAFSEPFKPQEKMAPVVLAIGRIYYSE